jgi:hypothetical protein
MDLVTQLPTRPERLVTLLLGLLALTAASGCVMGKYHEVKHGWAPAYPATVVVTPGMRISEDVQCTFYVLFSDDNSGASRHKSLAKAINDSTGHATAVQVCSEFTERGASTVPASTCRASCSGALLNYKGMSGGELRLEYVSLLNLKGASTTYIPELFRYDSNGGTLGLYEYRIKVEAVNSHTAKFAVDLNR